MGKAYVIGGEELILGFRSVGVETIAAADAQACAGELERLARDPEAALVLVTEDMVEEIRDAIDHFRESSRGVLLVIPTHEGSQGAGYAEIRRLVEQSLGLDMLGPEAETT
jgi:V/A-type H+/Na+-transporting ATPase subunit F